MYIRFVFLGLCAIAVTSCGVNYRVSDRSSRILAQRHVLRASWHRLLTQPVLMNYKPQEWASSAMGRDGTIYVGSNDRIFYAFDRYGKIKWALRTQGAIGSRPLLHETQRVIYFGADDGIMYAVATETGKIKWHYKTQGLIRRAPVLTDGLLIFTTNENRTYALDAATGKWRWQYDREAPEGFSIEGYAGVTVQNGVAYTGFSDGTCVALRARSGTAMWTQTLGTAKEREFNDVDTSPLLVNDLLLTASQANGVYALSRESGAVLWHYVAPGVVGVIADEERIYVTSSRRGVIALDYRGQELWRQEIPGSIPTEPILMDDVLLVASQENGLFLFTTDKGRVVQYFNPGHGISAAPTVDPHRVTLLSNGGRLYTFNRL